ncbi:helix-turn-helix transcriptional regulator [Entomohabitans teleogrylli]|uniref:helix-turn-helix transcriptional regulator n=1 Tax=Entomohabitans teleogrylli TaxID=1384589 RepID=UPI00073D2868|nr:LuxR C-terminal-related transcriptional regulator [Entomohabitans teleogrylli]
MDKKLTLHFSNKYMDLAIRALLESECSFLYRKLRSHIFQQFDIILLTDDIVSSSVGKLNANKVMVVHFGNYTSDWIISLFGYEVITWEWLLSASEPWQDFRINITTAAGKLTPKEAVVLIQISSGIDQKEIAKRLSLSLKKISQLKRAGMLKLGINNHRDLMDWFHFCCSNFSTRRR